MQVSVAYQLTRDVDGDDTSSTDVACLSAEEISRSARFVVASDRRDFIAAHALLRRALSALEPRDPAAWAFMPGPSGKPRLVEADGTTLTFNLSHTRGLVACVVARRGDVGIDVEHISGSADMLDVARHHFSSSEAKTLERCDDVTRAERFTTIWTLKEAHAKATGAGIVNGFAAPSFAFGEDGSLHVCPDAADAAAWTYVVFGVLDYRLAIAVRNDRRDAVNIEISQRGVQDGTRCARVLWKASALIEPDHRTREV